MAWHSHAINQSCPGMDVVSRIIEQERPIISMSALPQTSAQTSATTGTASAVTGSFRKTGEPDISESPLHPRRRSRRIMVGPVPVGGGAPISVQSMTNTDTNDTAASVAQIERIDRAGGHIVRLTAQGRREGENLREIVRQLRADGCTAAVVADIHFTPEVAAVAAQYVDKVRINPGNYRNDRGQFEALIDTCRARGVALRIGVNHGSLAKRVFDRWGDTPQGMVVSAMEFLRICRAKEFDQVTVSMKSSNTRVMVAAYRLLVEAMEAEGMRYPIHLGVTEAGNGLEGRIKSAVGIGALLADGIGDTIRVSLSAPPVEEVKVGCKLLEYMGLRKRKFDIISCPSCGRAQVDVIQLANAVTEGLKNVTAPIRVAVMGCIVNGPGEAREADLGVASGNGKGQIFIKGKVIQTVPEDQIVETLLAKAQEIAAQMEADGQLPATATGPVVVPVTQNGNC